MEYLTDESEITVSISRVAELTGISAATLRFYEHEGVLDPPRRNYSGQRVYGDKELSAIFGLLCMKKAGFKLPEIKEFFKLARQGDITLPQRLEMLDAQRERMRQQIRELEECLEYTGKKMAYMRRECEARQNGEMLAWGELHHLLQTFILARKQK